MWFAESNGKCTTKRKTWRGPELISDPTLSLINVFFIVINILALRLQKDSKKKFYLSLEQWFPTFLVFHCQTTKIFKLVFSTLHEKHEIK